MVTALVLCAAALPTAWAEPVKYVRFRVEEHVAYGIIEQDQVRELQGDLFGSWKPGDRLYPLTDVELLVPTEPRQVFAMAGNYRSHVAHGPITTTITTITTVTQDTQSQRPDTETRTTEQVSVPGEVPEKFQTPQPFLKPRACLTAHNTDIVLPWDSTDVHYEAELVVVIGKQAHHVDKQHALEHVLGVTCGNDVSERVWQKADVQWWRAKGADTFGPCGPYIVAGLDYDNLWMTLRLNGETRQRENTSQLIHDVASTVSFISHYTTLYPGDLIFTGTTGTTSAMKPGDIVEVEIEGVGVLRNRVVGEHE